jgi:hypothetical protein
MGIPLPVFSEGSLCDDLDFHIVPFLVERVKSHALKETSTRETCGNSAFSD